MTFYHKYSINELEQMVPFELDLFTYMTKAAIEEIEKKRKEQAGH